MVAGYAFGEGLEYEKRPFALRKDAFYIVKDGLLACKIWLFAG
jgi:hypothetical protein